MQISFKIYELTERFGIQEFDEGNEFIKVGEEKDYFLVHGVVDEGIRLINGLDIQTSAYRVPKSILKLKGDGTYSGWYNFDIDTKFLDIGIVQDIQRLNKL